MPVSHPLLDNLSALHTTPRGAQRIRQNLSLPPEADPAAWCRERIAAEGAALLRRGKNWYAMAPDCVITVNAASLTIITAHPNTRKKTRKDEVSP